MHVIIILSENADFVESLKRALAYTSQETLKFQFLSDIEGIRTYVAQYGQPELLLCDRSLHQTELLTSLKLQIVILSEYKTTSQGEVFIYQNVESFITDVNKMVNVSNNDFKASPAGKGKTIWLLDPCESSWSKACFKHLTDWCYTTAKRTLCVDASAFGGEMPNIHQAHVSNLSSYISAFLWGNEPQKQDACQDFYYIGAVKHPMDLMALEAEFWDSAFGTLAAGYSQRILYSGLYGESHLKKMVRHFDRLVIATQEPSVTLQQLKQLQEWFNQIEPKLSVKIQHANMDYESPEAFANQVVKWAELG